MSKEEKELLLKDLCSRLPYGVKVQYMNKIFDIDYISPMYGEVKLDTSGNWTIDVSEVNPYLFPLSNMTEKQKKEYNSLRDRVTTYHYENGNIVEDTELRDNWKSIDYLNANHFDYRGLIEKGLATDVSGSPIYSVPVH